jgi:hypothetical protein
MDDLIDQFSDEFDIFDVVGGKDSPERRRQKQLRFRLLRLQFYLERGNWSLEEAAHIVEGLDPEHSIYSTDPSRGLQLRCLPGLDMPRDEEKRENFYSEHLEAVEIAESKLSTLQDLSTLRIAKLVDKALAAGLCPPWLPTARANPELGKYLSENALKPPPLTRQERASKGGRVRAVKRYGPCYKAIDHFLDTKLSTACPKEWCNGSGKPVISTVADHVIKHLLEIEAQSSSEFEVPDKPAIEKRVKMNEKFQRWLAKRRASS